MGPLLIYENGPVCGFRWHPFSGILSPSVVGHVAGPGSGQEGAASWPLCFTRLEAGGPSLPGMRADGPAPLGTGPHADSL